METILVIEDDEGLNRGISFTLSKDGYQVLTAVNIAEGRAILHNSSPDLILLDLNLPDGDGINLCREIRKEDESDIPIIILTARDLETDEIMGLETGADDYITKPFSLAVLKIRVAVRLRKKRMQSEKKATPILHYLSSNNIRLCKDNRKVYKNGEEIILSATEFKLLLLFMEHSGQVLLKEQILSAVWDVDADFVDENTLSVNIRRMRIKLEDSPSKPRFINTVHGIGYIWKDRNNE